MKGYNPLPNKNSDDLQGVLSLLRDLPRVNAPADFTASLKARLAVAKAEASEFADISALVKDLPRVAAPADFDFKLRARIAQAKAEQQKPGWFAELFGRTFSWLQAGAVMAAVALVVSVVTFNVMKSGTSSQSENDKNNLVASVSPNISSTPVNTKTFEEVTTATNATPPGMPKYVSSPSTSRVKIIQASTGTIKHTNKITKDNETVPAPNPPEQVAMGTVMIKHAQSGEARMINVVQVSYGRSVKTQTARANVSTENASTMIY